MYSLNKYTDKIWNIDKIYLNTYIIILSTKKNSHLIMKFKS